MSSQLHFPSAEKMTEFLTECPKLGSYYYKQKGITNAIIEFAVERFADKTLNEFGVELELTTMIYDLQQGKDGINGKPLSNPDLGKVIIGQPAWNQIKFDTKLALLNCANNKV